MPRREQGIGAVLERLSSRTTAAAGTTGAFSLAVAIVLAWLISGPLFQFSNTWQLVINTSTTIVTFLMVFLLQRSQNKESLAVQLKLNELVAAMEGASNRLIDVEDLSEKELQMLPESFRQLVVMSQKDVRLAESHSIEEAAARHSRKIKGRSSRSG